VYNIKSDKAVAYDITISQLASFHDGNVMTKNVLYLGDSENDNPSFRKADVSIGVRSDERVNPRLDSKYILQFSELAVFLEKLQDNEFVFSKTFSINERGGKNCIYLLTTTITAIILQLPVKLPIHYRQPFFLSVEATVQVLIFPLLPLSLQVC
jgi:hypothetical protein